MTDSNETNPEKELQVSLEEEETLNENAKEDLTDSALAEKNPKEDSFNWSGLKQKAWFRPTLIGVVVLLLVSLVFLFKPLLIGDREIKPASSGKLCLVYPQSKRSSFDLLFQSNLEKWLSERDYQKIEKIPAAGAKVASTIAGKNCEIVVFSDPQYENKLADIEANLSGGEKLIYAYVGTGKSNPDLKQTQMYGFDLRNNAFIAGYVASGLTKTGRLGYAVTNESEQELAKAFKLGVDYYNLYKGSGIQILDWQENENRAVKVDSAKIPAVIQKQAQSQADIFFVPGSYQVKATEDKAESKDSQNSSAADKSQNSQQNSAKDQKNSSVNAKTELEIIPELLPALGDKNLFITYDLGTYRETAAYTQASSAVAEAEKSESKTQTPSQTNSKTEENKTSSKNTGSDHSQNIIIPLATLSTLLEKTPNLFSTLPIDTSEVYMQIYSELKRHHQKLVTADTSFAGSGAWGEIVGVKGQVSPVLRGEITALRKQLTSGELRIDQLQSQLK